MSIPSEFIRYIINGLVATAVHFGILSGILWLFPDSYAGLANGIAAIFGITTSYIGSRYYVFQKREESIKTQGIKFVALYGTIALFHAFVLFVWTDCLGLDYRLGFLLATGFQILGSYFGNKFLVFK